MKLYIRTITKPSNTLEYITVIKEMINIGIILKDADLLLYCP